MLEFFQIPVYLQKLQWNGVLFRSLLFGCCQIRFRAHHCQGAVDASSSFWMVALARVALPSHLGVDLQTWLSSVILKFDLSNFYTFHLGSLERLNWGSGLRCFLHNHIGSEASGQLKLLAAELEHRRAIFRHRCPFNYLLIIILALLLANFKILHLLAWAVVWAPLLHWIFNLVVLVNNL